MHFTPLGELDGVANKIPEHLGKPPLVATADWQVWGHRDLQCEMLLKACTFERCSEFLGQLPHRVVTDRKGEAPRPHPGNIEDLIDQVEQVSPILFYALQYVPNLFRYFAINVVPDQLHVA